jgi:hypothetical protein
MGWKVDSAAVEVRSAERIDVVLWPHGWGRGVLIFISVADPNPGSGAF